jgi:succinoglycan biosynthesis transport protein ExoP
VRDTQLLSISVRGADPALTRDIADTLAGVFIDQQTRRLEQHQVFSTVNVVQPALVPLQPIEPRPVVNVLASAAAALFVTLGLAYLLDRLDDVIRTSADIDLDGDVPILGVMPELSLAAQPQRPETLESLRTLRTMFELTTRDRPPASLLVTSAGSGEGKSTTAIGLSIMLARADKRVVLLDAHRARPSLHEVLDLDNDRGLTTLLRRASGGADESVRECLQRTAEPNLSVLTFGPPLPDAVDLSSRGLASVLRALEGEADIVVVDGPSTLEAADGLILAQHVHATVLVARAGATRLEALAGALTALDPVGTDVLGIVLNATGAKPSGWPVIEAMTSQLASLSTSRTASPCD